MTYAMIQLQDYATFETIEEMDENVRHFNRQLSKVHYETLNLLKQYSLKIIGVSHLKIDTIAAKLNKSRRTIENHIRYLKDQGYITVVNTSRRKQGGKGANAYVINTVDYRKKWLKRNNCVSKVAHRNTYKYNRLKQQAQAFAYLKVKKETIESLSYLNSIKSTQSSNNRDNRDIRICPNGVPEYIWNIMRPFFNDKEIQRIYLNVKKDMQFFNKTHTVEEIKDVIEIAIKSLLNAKRDYKAGRRYTDVHNPVAYVSAAAWHRAINIELGNDIDDYITPVDHSGYRTLYA